MLLTRTENINTRLVFKLLKTSKKMTEELKSYRAVYPGIIY